MLAWSGCSSQKKDDGRDTDTARREAPQEEVLEEFSSPDLGLWQLTGPVSGAVFYSYAVNDDKSLPASGEDCGLDSITFNEQGLVTSLIGGNVEKGKLVKASDLRFRYDENGNFVSGQEAAAATRGLRVKLSRSSGGYLQVLQVLGSDGEISNDDAYIRLIEWTSGTLYSDETESADGTVRTVYTYNDDGLPEKITSTIADMSGDIKITEHYSYTAADKYGNWTERRVRVDVENTEGEADGTNMKTTRSHNYRLDRRKIYYRPPAPGKDAAGAATP